MFLISEGMELAQHITLSQFSATRATTDIDGIKGLHFSVAI
jgi:hypothetical protein